MEKIKVGILLLDEKIIYYQNKMETFTDIKKIPEDILWYSDIQKEQLWRLGYLNKLNIKHENYLNTPFNQIRNVINDSDLKKFLAKIYYLFNEIINISFNKYNLNIHSSELYKGINIFNESESEKVIPNFISNALKKSYQEEIIYLSDEESKEYENNGYNLLTMKKNGMVYCKDILNNIYIPDDGFIVLSLQDLIRQVKELKYSSITEYLSNLQQPFLFNYSQKNLRLKYKDIENIFINNEYTYDLTKRIERDWLTSYEFEYLKHFYDFNYSNIILFHNSISKDSIFNTYGLKGIEDYGDISYFSIILTILAENYSLALQSKNNMNVNYLNTFVSAYEKKELIALSILLLKQGYILKSFGKNKIYFYINNETNMIKLIEMANNYGYHIY